MRRLLAGLALSLAASTAAAQPVFGTCSSPSPQGGTITMTLTRGGGGTIGGTLTLNDVTLNVAAAEMLGEDVRGVAKNETVGSLFHAHRAGDELRLILADPKPDGQPDLARARQFVLTRQGATPSATAGTGTAGGTVRGETAEDTKLIQLLESRASCTFSFSNGSTYTGGSYSSSSGSRTVFSPNGVVR